MIKTKKKYYAVRPPLGPRVLESWKECSALVSGVSGARYKSFPDRAAAEAWAHQRDPEPLTEGLFLYVDGSFISGHSHAGWAVAAVEGGELLWTLSGITAEPALSRNIDGELEGAAQAIFWLRKNPQPATICHDYEGIARWALGEWKRTSVVAKRYVERVQPLPEELRFEKIKAHSGEQWNELVDDLARGALLDSKKVL